MAAHEKLGQWATDGEVLLEKERRKRAKAEKERKEAKEKLQELKGLTTAERYCEKITVRSGTTCSVCKAVRQILSF